MTFKKFRYKALTVSPPSLFWCFTATLRSTLLLHIKHGENLLGKGLEASRLWRGYRFFAASRLSLYFFTTLITVDRLWQIFGTTVRASFRMRFLSYRLSTLCTEFPVRRQILTASGALLENEQLVATVRTEFGPVGNRMLTIRTF